MLRIMKIIDKDYKDKWSNYRDKETVHVNNVHSKRTKDVELVMKTKKDVLFKNQIKYGGIQANQGIAPPVCNIISKIKQERIDEVVNLKIDQNK